MNLQNLLIRINREPMQIGEQLPDSIHSLEIVYQALIPIQFPQHQKLAIITWFNTILDRLTCEHVMYNGTIIPTNELNRIST